MTPLSVNRLNMLLLEMFHTFGLTLYCRLCYRALPIYLWNATKFPGISSYMGTASLSYHSISIPFDNAAFLLAFIAFRYFSEEMTIPFTVSHLSRTMVRPFQIPLVWSHSPSFRYYVVRWSLFPSCDYNIPYTIDNVNSFFELKSYIL